jgi:cob(I)alamin adenosyltransferase
MKIYTRTGDEGQTSVIGGGRISKDDLRVEAFGTIDELNALVGQAIAGIAASGDNAGILRELADKLTVIQHELFDCGSDLSYAKPEPDKLKVTGEMTLRLERWIDECEQLAPPIRRFILPGGSLPAASLHVCRTVCRRAERRVVALAAQQPCPAEVRRYLNRLSDFFFAAARAVNAALGVPDVEYERSAIVFRRGNPQ